MTTMYMDANLRTVGFDELVGCSSYNDGEIAILCPSCNVEQQINESVRLGMTLLVICTDGETEYFMNGNKVVMKKNDLLICPANVVFDGFTNATEIQFKTMCLSPELMLRLRGLTRNSWDFLQYIKQNPIVTLTEEQVELFCKYYDMLCSALSRKSGNRYKEVVYSLLTAFFYELFAVVEAVSPNLCKDITSADLIFQKYIDLISSMYPRNRTVAYYADKLNVTPKYLSVVCKQIGGKTALHYINAYVNEDIRQLLTKTTKTIKEICAELDFANLSFFGKYVRRQFGVGPSVYRKLNKV